MKEPRCIRYFSSYEKALKARDFIKSEGFNAEVTEDTFGTLTLDRLGMPLRFRLYVERGDIGKIAKILAGKLKNS